MSDTPSFVGFGHESDSQSLQWRLKSIRKELGPACLDAQLRCPSSVRHNAPKKWRISSIQVEFWFCIETVDEREKRLVGMKMLDEQWSWIFLQEWRSKDMAFTTPPKTMERTVDRCNSDSIRNAMLKHEEIFSNQLHELHRIYTVQKKMMVDERSKEGKNQSFVSAGSRMLTDTRLRQCYSSSNSESSHSSHVSSTCYLHPICKRADGANGVQSCIDMEQPAREYGYMEAREGHNHITLFGKKLKETRIEGSQLWIEDESSIQLTLSIGR